MPSGPQAGAGATRRASNASVFAGAATSRWDGFRRRNAAGFILRELRQARSGAVALLVLLAAPAPARVVAPDLLGLVDPPLLDGLGSGRLLGVGLAGRGAARGRGHGHGAGLPRAPGVADPATAGR